MVNKATGNKWIEKCAATTVQKGSILGVLIDPVKGLVSVYINDKILPEAMPVSQAAVTALSDPKVCVRTNTHMPPHECAHAFMCVPVCMRVRMLCAGVCKKKTKKSASPRSPC